MANLTKESWRGLRVALQSVPVKSRNLPWKKALQLVDRILAGVSELALEFNLETMKYSVECELCHAAIGVDEDYVFKSASSTYHHYCCYMTNDNGKIGEKWGKK